MKTYTSRIFLLLFGFLVLSNSSSLLWATPDYAKPPQSEGEYEFRKARYRVGGRQPYWEPGQEKPAWAKNEAKTPMQDEESPATTPQTTAGGKDRRWHIVVASLRSQDDARQFAAKVTGTSPQVVYRPDLQTYRVVYRSFASVEQAQPVYKEVQNRYRDAWLVKF